MTWLVILTLFVCVLTFLFLPQLTEVLKLSTIDPQPSKKSKCLRFIFNLRYKFIAYLTFHKPHYVGKIGELRVFPIKSVSYLDVHEWPIDEHGFKYDRQYMLAFWDAKNNIYEAVTLRIAPRLALCKLSSNLEENYIELTYPILDKNANNTLNEYKSFRLPCDVTEDFINANLVEPEPKLTNLWSVHFQSSNIGKILPQEFKDSMNISNRPGITLLYSKTGKWVKTGHSLTGLDKMRSTKFQDYFPMHIIAQRDIDLLNQNMLKAGFTRKVGALNFRANVSVVDMPLNRDLDLCYKVKIGSNPSDAHPWTFSIKTPRCSVPNVELDKGSFDKANSVSKTLRKYRRVDPGEKNYTFLGNYAIHNSSGYMLRKGDNLYVTEERISTYLNLE